MAVCRRRGRAEPATGRINMTNVESTGTIRHFRRLRQLALIAPLAVTASAMVCSSASAAPEEEKVFVCKFVGTPGGADETLQTGQNPVSVSVNALPAGVPAQVGSTFNDQQGRSVVLAFDVGQPDPDVSECEQF